MDLLEESGRVAHAEQTLPNVEAGRRVDIEPIEEDARVVDAKRHVENVKPRNV